MARTKQSRGQRILKTAEERFRPDYKKPEYIAQQELRTLTNAMWEGTRAIRAGGETFVPSWPAEDPRHYKIRKEIAQVVRYYRRVVEAAVGMICATPPALEEKAHARLKEFARDVDGQGTAFGPYAKQVITAAANDGFVGVLVDFPSLPPDIKLRLDQEHALGLRPFMVKITADRMPSWIIEYPNWELLIKDYLDGIISAETAKAYAKQVILRQVVIHEPQEVTEPNAFGSTVVDHFRVLRLEDSGVTFKVWKHVKPKNGGAEYYEVVAEGAMLALGKPQWEIPLTLVYGGIKKAPFVADPALLGVAELNLDHHNITIDRRYLIRLCHAPTLFLAGFDDENDSGDDDAKSRPKKSRKVGPNSVLSTSNENAKASYVVAPSDALDSSQIEKLEVVKQIQATSMAFIGVDRKTAETATGRQLDDAAENANIATVSESGRDGLEQIWKYMAMHVEGAEEPGVEMQTSYASPNVDPQIANILWAAVAADKLDVDTWIHYMKTGELPDDVAKRVEFLRIKNARNEGESDEDEPSPYADDEEAEESTPPEKKKRAA